MNSSNKTDRIKTGHGTGFRDRVTCSLFSAAHVRSGCQIFVFPDEMSGRAVTRSSKAPHDRWVDRGNADRGSEVDGTGLCLAGLGLLLNSYQFN